LLWVRTTLLGLLSTAPVYAGNWPTTQWETSSPEAQGVDARDLADAITYIRVKHLPIHSLLVVRHGVVVLDAYFYPYDQHSLHDIASVTKSVTSILTGIAIDGGYLRDVDQPILSLIPGHAQDAIDASKSKITIGNLLTMTSGLKCGALGGIETAETELAEMRRSADWISYAVNLPMRSDPGTQFAYCSINNHLLSAIITAQTGEGLQSFAQRNLFSPLGIHDVFWPTDPTGLNHGWADLHMHPQDMAKLGYLYLRNGKWEDQQIVSAQWVRQSVSSHVTVRPGIGYGYGWWINLDRDPQIPEAEGRGGQRISIVPDKDAVVVFTSGGANTDEIAPYLLRALRSNIALPQNAKADEALNLSIKAANQPPKPLRVGQLPAIARAVSGREYILEPNPIDLRSIILNFPNGDNAQVSMRFDGQAWTGAIGLDGVYRFSPHGYEDLPMAMRGYWKADNEFSLDVDLVQNITHLFITLRYFNNGAQVVFADSTASVPSFNVAAHVIDTR